MAPVRRQFCTSDLCIFQDVMLKNEVKADLRIL